jgi:hypothetical protein
MVWSQLQQIVHETLSRKKPFTKKGWCSGWRCRPWVQTPVPSNKQTNKNNNKKKPQAWANSAPHENTHNFQACLEPSLSLLCAHNDYN